MQLPSPQRFIAEQACFDITVQLLLNEVFIILPSKEQKHQMQ